MITGELESSEGPLMLPRSSGSMPVSRWDSAETVPPTLQGLKPDQTDRCQSPHGLSLNRTGRLAFADQHVFGRPYRRKHNAGTSSQPNPQASLKDIRPEACLSSW